MRILNWLSRLYKDTFSAHPKTGLEFIGRLWVFVLLWIFPGMLVGALAGGIIYGGLRAKLAYIGDFCLGMVILSALVVLIIGIRKVWRNRQE